MLVLYWYGLLVILSVGLRQTPRVENQLRVPCFFYVRIYKNIWNTTKHFNNNKKHTIMKQLKNSLSILSVLTILLSLLTTTSCAPEAEKEDIICKVSVISSEGGIGVSSLYEVISGEEVTLKAVPEATYRFVNWTVDDKEVSKENPYTTTITSTTQFKANFEKKNQDEDSENDQDIICKVSVISSEGGIGVSSLYEAISGEEVTLKAVPEATYRFVNWTVDDKEVSKENPYTTTITSTTQFKANFEKDFYTIKVTAEEGGTVKSTKEGELLNGTEVTLTATPSKGYNFVNWTVNGEEVSTEATHTVTVINDIEYVANFELITTFVYSSSIKIQLGTPEHIEMNLGTINEDVNIILNSPAEKTFNLSIKDINIPSLQLAPFDIELSNVPYSESEDVKEINYLFELDYELFTTDVAIDINGYKAYLVSLTGTISDSNLSLKMFIIGDENLMYMPVVLSINKK